ncbi:Lrp/AsnC family transcriptional regulator [Sphingorhabdus sp. EL138]|uniref:Lrp/AsnC family transcriptional regulator n=1 Tax=Sphingorhabdus sp. EL138 TaxID=2073156 RepID=UPI000D69A8F9|nr:Lrp/AsnC family transcriptional regulator [Sphingorhabdus sp. EL138]
MAISQNIIDESSIDRMDRKLLNVLQKDGRITNANLSDCVGLSPAACHQRVKRLQNDGIIQIYTAILDRRISGCSQSAFVHITLSSQDHDTIEAFEAEVVKCANIIECHLMTGDYDYLLHVIVRDATEYEQLHRNVLTSLPGVDHLTSSFALRAVCRTTEIPLKM